MGKQIAQIFQNKITSSKFMLQVLLQQLTVTNMLTDSSWEADSRSADQEIRRLYKTPTFNIVFNASQLTGSMLNLRNLVYTHRVQFFY
jgi:hypothetical protein